jgi:hypothetical protein
MIIVFCTRCDYHLIAVVLLLFDRDDITERVWRPRSRYRRSLAPLLCEENRTLKAVSTEKSKWRTGVRARLS